MPSPLTRATDFLYASLLSALPERLIKPPPIALTRRDVGRPEPVRVPTRHGAVRCYVTRASPDAPLAVGGARPPVHIHLHGGAFLIRAPHQDEHLVRGIAGEVGATVVNVDYSTAPRARFPQAHEECHDVLRWVQRSGDAMGWDGARVSIGGISAGGNLALGALELARREGAPPVRACVLVVPNVDQTLPPESYTSPLPPSPGRSHRPFVSARLIRIVQQNYFVDASRGAEPLASPVLNDAGIGALPPLLVVTAEQDSMRAQDERFIAKARSKGVAVTAHCVRGVDHGFPQSAKKEDEAAVRELAERIRAHLAEHLA
jgi:acetyl esterase